MKSKRCLLLVSGEACVGTTRSELVKFQPILMEKASENLKCCSPSGDGVRSSYGLRQMVLSLV